MRAAKTSDGPVSPADILTEMKVILSTESAWQPGRIARREDGTVTHSTNLMCVRRSLPGALLCALSFYANRWTSPFPAVVEDLLTKAAGQRYDLFDEAPGTTFTDVIRVITDAQVLAAPLGKAALRAAAE